MNNRLNIKQLLANNLQQRCVLCAAPHGADLGLCEDCAIDLPWYHEAQCPQCAINISLKHHQICGTCLQTPPAFDQTIAMMRYAFPINALLQAYKYEHRLPLAHFFASLFIKEYQFTEKAIDCLVPMPMHPKRLQERGFNQALEIARLLSRAYQIPLDFRACTRTKNTPPQASLALKQRINNMAGAFACNTDFTGRHIAIIDDVMTTGASMHALASVLKKAGAKTVECWVIARTLAY